MDNRNNDMGMFDNIEEPTTTICLGGRFYTVPKSIAKNIFTTITNTPPIETPETDTLKIRIDGLDTDINILE